MHFCVVLLAHACSLRLCWQNQDGEDTDDLDLHCSVLHEAESEPAEISYKNTRAAGGELDVDMRSGVGRAVEVRVPRLQFGTQILMRHPLNAVPCL